LHEFSVELRDPLDGEIDEFLLEVVEDLDDS